MRSNLNPGKQSHLAKVRKWGDEEDGEEEYNSHAMKITKFIEKEYGIEPESYSPISCFSSYHWKPTPNTILVDANPFFFNRVKISI